MNIKLKQIGIIKTSYIDNAPYQPVDDEKNNFNIIIDNKFTKGLLHPNSIGISIVKIKKIIKNEISISGIFFLPIKGNNYV